MVSALFDTNILIDHLNAIPQARAEIERYGDRAISIITWMEVMVDADAEVAEPTRLFLEGLTVVELHDGIAERAVTLRRTRVENILRDIQTDCAKFRHGRLPQVVLNNSTLAH